MPKTEDPAAFQAARTNLLFNLAANLPVAADQNITIWEEVTCAGFNPQLSLLEAVVSIKQPTGYSGGLCSAGSNEYVRFFVDYGAGFEDAGVTSFRVHDIPDAPPGPQHPIHYLVQMPLNDASHRRRCYAPVIPKVRAVLSWNQIPSLNPNDLPHFGNRLDAFIQLRPRPWHFGGLVTDGLIKADSKILDLIDLEQPIALAKDVAASLPSLVADYRKAEVPAHRFLAPAMQPLLEGGESLPFALAFPHPELAKKLEIDWASVLKALQALQGNPTYEQLTCVGLDPDTDTLGAVIHVKRPFGYSGDLCRNGSREHVAFWADWNNDGTFDEYLGTASVEVHDLGAALPSPEGVRYSVRLNAPQIVQHLRRCSNPNIIRIRAVLQWSTPPSTTNPNAPIAWGNLLDVLVQLRPGRATDGTELTDLIYRVGGVGLPDISPVTHLAFPSSVFITSPPCSQPLRDRPWGGDVSIQGRIYNTGIPGSVRYRVRFKPHAALDIDSNWSPVTLSQSYTLMFPLLTPPEVPVNQTASSEPGLGGGWFDYVENPLASPPIFERDNLLANWSTGALEGVYDLRLEYRRVTDPAGFYHSSNLVTIVLHNYQMTATFLPGATIDFTKDVDLVIDGGDCHSYPKGNTINGHLRCVDPFFWTWNLDLQPVSHTHGAQASPSCRTYASLADSGDGNLAWTLNTAPMDKCGYTLTLRGYDRTIVNSNGSSVHSNGKAIGFSVV